MAIESAIEAKPREFFSFNAGYLIQPGARTNDLLEDAVSWLVAATETVNVLAIDLEDKDSQLCVNPHAAARMLWGTFHLLRMAHGVVEAANAKLMEARS